jgi:hypothetical protein
MQHQCWRRARHIQGRATNTLLGQAISEDEEFAFVRSMAKALGLLCGHNALEYSVQTTRGLRREFLAGHLPAVVEMYRGYACRMELLKSKTDPLNAFLNHFIRKYGLPVRRGRHPEQGTTKQVLLLS